MTQKNKQTSLPFNKYGNSIVYYDTDTDTIVNKTAIATQLSTLEPSSVLRFDSILEFEVYKILRSGFDKKSIIHHFKIEILPKTDFDKALTWCVDFRVCKDFNVFYVEAKGVETDDYSLRQRLLQRFQPSTFNRVMTVKKEDLFKFAHRIKIFELWKDGDEISKY